MPVDTHRHGRIMAGELGDGHDRDALVDAPEGVNVTFENVSSAFGGTPGQPYLRFVVTDRGWVALPA